MKTINKIKEWFAKNINKTVDELDVYDLHVCNVVCTYASQQPTLSEDKVRREINKYLFPSLPNTDLNQEILNDWDEAARKTTKSICSLSLPAQISEEEGRKQTDEDYDDPNGALKSAIALSVLKDIYPDGLPADMEAGFIQGYKAALQSQPKEEELPIEMHHTHIPILDGKAHVTWHGDNPPSEKQMRAFEEMAKLAIDHSDDISKQQEKGGE